MSDIEEEPEEQEEQEEYDVVTNVTGEIKALANKINWNPINNLSFDPNGIVDISKSVLGETNFGDLTLIGSNIPLSDNHFFDYDIDMRKDYKYELKINDNTSSYKKCIYISSLSEQVSNCSASYDFNTNKITINWNNINSFDDKLDVTTITYNIWIHLKSNNGNLVKFESNTNSIIISSGDIAFDTETDSDTNFTIQKGEYYIYITPKFVTERDQYATITKEFPINYFKNENSVIANPNIRLNVLPETPKNFKISSAYNNGKISLSWSKPKSDPEITPTQYRLLLINLSTNNPIYINLNGNTLNHTIDNTNLESTSALEPGSYNISLSAIYYSLESEYTNTLNFTVPITNIDFEYELVDENGVLTENIKNGVAGIILKWKPFSYATYYRINIQQFNENGDEEDTEVYHVQHPTKELALKWNFPTQKSRFLINISYTRDTNFDPVVNHNALGESYLGEPGIIYSKEFSLSFTSIVEDLNIDDLDLSIDLDAIEGLPDLDGIEGVPAYLLP